MPYYWYMKFLQHIYFEILRSAYFTTLIDKFNNNSNNFMIILIYYYEISRFCEKFCTLNHFNFTFLSKM